MSEDFNYYLVLKRFWQNLGLNAEDISKFKQYDFEIINEMMILEEQYQNKEVNKNQSKLNYGNRK